MPQPVYYQVTDPPSLTHQAVPLICMAAKQSASEATIKAKLYNQGYTE